MFLTAQRVKVKVLGYYTKWHREGAKEHKEKLCETPCSFE
jgi:hypothetical protein